MPQITNDATVFGLLMSVLAFVFYTSSLKSAFWKKFYSIVPTILLCYFIPGVFNSIGLIDGEKSKLYDIASKYLLPACLVYFTINLDFESLKRLGPKAIFVFLAGTVGVMVGGPVAYWLVKSFHPEAFDINTWRGLATIAGSWIGGSANQTALKDVFNPDPVLFSQVIAVDVLTAELWLGVLLYGIGHNIKINRWLNANDSSIKTIQKKLSEAQKENEKNPDLADIIMILFVGFGITAIAHLAADTIVPFIENNFPSLKKYSLTSTSFWVISVATLGGILFSQTKARKIEDLGASKFGSLFLYILIATIGMKMDLGASFGNPWLFLVGLIWITIHAIFTIIVAKWLKAPYFFAAVGSQANVGGAASASIIAGAFSPSLVSVGVLLAILGYALGTYLGYITGIVMSWI